MFKVHFVDGSCIELAADRLSETEETNTVELTQNGRITFWAPIDRIRFIEAI